MTKIEVYGCGVSLSSRTPMKMIASDLEVHVDGQKIGSPYEGLFGIEHKEAHSFQIGELGKCYYVKMMEEDGLWLTRETSEPFDPEKLEIEIFDYVLPDKSDHQVGGAFIWRNRGQLRPHGGRCYRGFRYLF